MKRFLSLAIASLMALGEAIPTAAVLAAAALAAVPSTASALPDDRATGRREARESRQTGNDVSRARRATGRQGVRPMERESRRAQRQADRDRRRGISAAPAGSVVRTHGDYRYYFADGRYYYPYMYAGRTVYVEIATDSSGAPLPPPACEDVDLSF